ncbi:hypothetical protein [Candidatus Contendibacter odensensis]|uniref:hypothetical protein n=1 Tax=Candidatus Contendibacter odensensis TaxID=1400860 RepID=UPI0004B2BED4|nr:hypothetical protein [Candidatus Contendobacter odensis]
MVDAKKSLDEVRATIANLEALAHQKWLNRNAIAAELNSAVSAPMTREDAAPIIGDALDSLAMLQSTIFRRLLGGLFGNGVRESAHDQNEISKLLQYESLNADHFARDWLAALLLPTLKAGLPAALENLEWPDGALPAADRARKIAEFESILAKADAEFADVLLDLEGLGIAWNANHYLAKIAA